ncbi:MAG: hypothetical protein JXQ29_11510 [Planctomycetes bacterium]|nr:hypothetical protein [Planctomycetota bacterium]
MRSPIRALAAFTFALALSVANAQSIVEHQAPCLSDPGGNLFLRLNADGAKLLINRSPTAEAEELVMLPRDGVTEEVWLRRSGRSIYDRFAVSGDGTKIAFAGDGSEVFVVTRAGGTPQSIANVAPDGDIRQLVLSQDGGLAAFTASRFRENGELVRVRSNLYIAATDGSHLWKITAAPVFQKFIPFALSGDGTTVVWVDDPALGPWIAGTEGQNAMRLPAAPTGQRIQNVFCNTNAAKVYYQTVAEDGVRIQEVDRGTSAMAVRCSAAHGFFELSSDASKIHLCQTDSAQARCGSWSMWNGTSFTKHVTLVMPRHCGSWARSSDGETLVWRNSNANGQMATFVWRLTAP